MTETSECTICKTPIARENPHVRWHHAVRELDEDHKPWKATGTYLDSPGMRAAHLRSMGR